MNHDIKKKGSYGVFASTNIIQVSISFVFLEKIGAQIISVAEFIICLMAIIATVILIYVHDFEFYYMKRDFVKNVLAYMNRIYRKFIVLIVSYSATIFIMVSFTQKILAIIALALLFVLVLGAVSLLVYFGLHYLKDLIWIRKNSIESNNLQRIQLERNLENIYFDRLKYKYLDMLLLQNIELTGGWTDIVRPQYEDDRVDHVLAKLDCAKLDSCDYLF